MKKDEKALHYQRDKQRFADTLKKGLIAKGYQARGNVLEREFNLRYRGTPITPHTAAKWLRGESIPRLDKLRTLAIWLNVALTTFVSNETLEKLEEGEARRSSPLEKYRWEKLSDNKDKALFNHFLALPEAQQNVVREVIIALYKRYCEK
ncbi:hypothetical protein QV09_02990 [Gallibacterium salpingitidis]|uniref:DNA-binding protein n=1 Tax=Gallibacterium salpingitidis TaxID=505341 RepID=A0A1A7NQU0_9PAST|nr:hypothetical protein [Gallibacterium salpingitidis]OBW91886.1 hypothetical protein QS62_10000 [Gallibacterium salpingitidis]OBX11311.1 hypothetical protein QV09_02990 [Gallibacterium salpingitidis]WKS99252.1 hypothetical protein NYR30_11055 [Gallibacterium salpingitidis]